MPRAKKIKSSDPILDNSGEKKLVEINEVDTNYEQKKIKLWLIVGFFIIFLILFWLYLLSNSISRQDNKNKTDQSLNNIISDISSQLAEAKNSMTDIGEQISKSREVEEIRNGIIEDLKKDISSESWPAVKLNNLSVKYPTDWQYKLLDSSVILTSYDQTVSTTTENFAQVIINKKENKKKLSLQDFFNTTKDKTQYLIDPSDLIIADKKAIKFVKKESEIEINWLIYFSQNETEIYEINMISTNSTFNILLSNILKEIRFIK